MISATNSHYVSDTSSVKNGGDKSNLTREKLFYKISCLCYSIIGVVLLTFFAVRAFRHKYQDTECYVPGLIDTTITILTLVMIFLGSALMITSLKYVFEAQIVSRVQSPVTSSDKADNFIRRNSQVPSINITRNPSISSASWLTTVRAEAYETQRRLSMVPHLNSLASKK